MPIRYIQVAAVALFTAAVVAFSAYVVTRDVEPPRSEATDLVQSPEPSETESSAPSEPTASSSTTPQPVTLDGARELLASEEPLVISVLGDTSGEVGANWVGIWARDYLTQDRTVVLHTWDDAAGEWAEQVTLSTSGPLTEVWDFSVPGESADHPVDRLESAQPQQPDLVLYDFARGSTARTIGPELRRTTGAVAAQWGEEPASVLVAQNPVTTPRAEQQDATVTALLRTVGPQLGLPVIDVYREFESAGTPLDGLLADGTYPSETGALLWARVVADALG